MLPTHDQCTVWPGLLSTVLTAASLSTFTGKDLLSQPSECLLAALPHIALGNLAIYVLSKQISSNTSISKDMIIMLVGIMLYIIGVILEAPLLYTPATAVSIGPIGAEIGNAPGSTLRLFGSTLALSLVIHIIAVLLGAPLLDKLWSTAYFSIILGIIVVFCTTNQLGIVDSDTYTRVFLKHRPLSNSEMAAYIQGLSPLVGAWLGAVVIPLDWERPWQQWPISCVLGAVVGQAIGSVATAVLYYMPTTVENDDRKTQ